MTEKQIRERQKRWNRQNYLRHRENRLEYARRYREARREELRNWQRAYRKKINRSPELYAQYAEYRRQYNSEHAEHRRTVNARWRAAHKRKVRMARRWYADRIRCQCRNDPGFYAMIRARDRAYKRKYKDRDGRVRVYRPMVSRRIPDTCCYDRVLDTRSVFLWNNCSAASLRAGEAYRRMMWREAHCDRFGEVCR